MALILVLITLLVWPSALFIGRKIARNGSKRILAKMIMGVTMCLGIIGIASLFRATNYIDISVQDLFGIAGFIGVVGFFGDKYKGVDLLSIKFNKGELSNECYLIRKNCKELSLALFGVALPILLVLVVLVILGLLHVFR
ncbi:hypothetical protein ACPUYX_06550 [Desulfosporosinus sp. SYSU MS00001]|uniref:hypothetical protein n=1 Tax=Desulfosporosinus sp. SYSU MS00001 TaxID=3416284 RepID=UPI003CEC9295